MFKFKEYLIEKKNTHMEHAEDDVLNGGVEGTRDSINALRAVRDMLAGHSKSKVDISVKWDGAPAVFAGQDPTDGKFFVGTKSVFSKTEPKLCKSTADIKKFYGEAEGLAAKLEVALKYLSKLGIGGVFQGDLMFTPGDLEQININGQDYITFTPNTITYAVPVDSLLAKKILRAKIGIIFHTKYEGDSIGNMQAGFGASVEGEIEAITGVEDGHGSDTASRRESLETSLRFIEETGVDVFAPSIGNAHGTYKTTPVIDFDRVSDIVKAHPIPIALHGGSGLTLEQFKELISRGCAKINISTALKELFMKSSLEFLIETQKKDKWDPPSLFASTSAQVVDMVVDLAEQFGSKGKVK